MKITKIALVVLALIFVSYTVNAQYLRKMKLKQDITYPADTVQILTEKSPLLAGTLSFIVPGLALGQFYNGQILKGMLHVAISGLGIALFFSGFDMGGGHDYSTMTTAGFLLYLGNWIYTTFEAAAAAEKINKQIKLQKNRSDVMDKMRFGFTVNKNKQLNLKFAFDL